MKPETHRLARIEPVKSLPCISWLGRDSHGFRGVDIWSESKVEPIDYNADYLSIAEFLEGFRKGEIEVGGLTCERCLSALAIRARDS